MTTHIRNAERYSDADLLRITKGKLPALAAERLFTARASVAAYDAASDGFFNSLQVLQSNLLDAKYAARHASDESTRDAALMRVENISKQIERAKAQRGAAEFSGDYVEQITRDVVKAIRAGKVFASHEPELPPQAAAADAELLAQVRAEIDAKRAKIAEIERAAIPVKDAIAALRKQVVNFRAAGAPTLAPILHPDFEDGIARPRHAEFARQYVGGDRFIPDAFHLMFWAFGEEILGKCEAALKEAAAKRRMIPISERAPMIEKIKSEIVREERIEAALVWRLRDQGRSDITHRQVDWRALLGVKLGRVSAKKGAK